MESKVEPADFNLMYWITIVRIEDDQQSITIDA